MGFNTIGQLFMPKNKIFFGFFEEIAVTLVQMGELLKKMVFEADANKRAAIVNELSDLEHRNDDTTHKIYIELGRNFITPFDREDIHELASALDDIADYIFGSAKRINYYKVNPNDVGIQKMSELIEQSTTHVATAIRGLRTMKNSAEIMKALVRINEIENQADDIYDMSIDALFNLENNFKEVIKKREIYQSLENASDMCEDASNVIESIIVKYS